MKSALLALVPLLPIAVDVLQENTLAIINAYNARKTVLFAMQMVASTVAKDLQLWRVLEPAEVVL